jgi:hypothetical protein
MGKPIGKSLGGPIGALYPNAVGSNPSAAVANTAMRTIFKKRTLSDLNTNERLGLPRNEGLPLGGTRRFLKLRVRHSHL